MIDDDDAIIQVPIDPVSPSDEVGYLATSVAAVARAYVTRHQKIQGGPYGRPPDPETEEAWRADVMRLRSAYRPIAADFIQGLDKNLNGWFGLMLETELTTRNLTRDDFWLLLEELPQRYAFRYLAAPRMQREIEAIQGTGSAADRDRLRRAFRRIAVPPHRAGRRRGVSVSKKAAAEVRKWWPKVLKMVSALRARNPGLDTGDADDEFIGDVSREAKRCGLPRYVRVGPQLVTLVQRIARTGRSERVADFVVSEIVDGVSAAQVRPLRSQRHPSTSSRRTH